MEDSNYLILKKNNTGMITTLANYIQDEKFENMYKTNIAYDNFIFKVIRKLNLPIIIFLFGNWKQKLKQYQKIIIFDDGYHEAIAKYIKKHHPTCEINFFYWNNINAYNKKFLKDPNIDKIWTFYEKNAKTYQLFYNPQFYTKKIVLPKEEETIDVLFLGRDKQRKNEILQIQQNLENKSLTTDFRIIESEKDLLLYQEYLILLQKTKCILDIVNNGQAGLTLRAMESLFLEKKLITNNQSIVEFDFYHPQNIFVIGKDNIEEIESFLQTPYQSIEQPIVEYYEYEHWIKRFFK